MSREEALDRIASLVREHDLSADEVLAVLPPDNRDRAETSNWAQRLLAIVGGLLVLAGLVGALNLVWDDLVPATRVLAVFGSGLVLLVLGIVACRDRAFEAAASPLFLVAGLFQTAGLFVLLNEYSFNADDAVGGMLIFGVLSVQFACLFTVLKRTDLLFLLLLSATLFFCATLVWMDVDEGPIGLILGVSGLLVTYGLERTPWRAVCGLAWFAYPITAAIGLFDLVEGAFPFDLLLVVAAVVLVQLSVHLRSRPLLVSSILILLGILAYFTSEYFADVLGWPIALILFGLVLLGLSGYALRLGRGMK